MAVYLVVGTHLIRFCPQLADEELAEAPGLSPRSISGLDRGYEPHCPEEHRLAAGRSAEPGRADGTAVCGGWLRARPGGWGAGGQARYGLCSIFGGGRDAFA
jgi:hypothetical protein